MHKEEPTTRSPVTDEESDAQRLRELSSISPEHTRVYAERLLSRDGAPRNYWVKAMEKESCEADVPADANDQA